MALKLAFASLCFWFYASQDPISGVSVFLFLVVHLVAELRMMVVLMMLKVKKKYFN